MAAHRYWRIYVDQSVDADGYRGLVGASDIQMRGVASGPDLTVPGGPATTNMPVYDDDVVSNGVLNAFDASTSTMTRLFPTYDGAPYPWDVWIQYDFGAGTPQDIVQIVWRTGSDSGTWRCPAGGRIMSSDDGVTWTEEWRYKFTASGDNITKTTTRPVALGAGARYWALYGRDADNEYDNFSIMEMELKDTPGGTDRATGGAAFSSSNYSGTAATAFNNNTSDVWQCNDYESNYSHIGYGFASGTNRIIDEITIRSTYIGYPREGGIYYSANAIDFALYWSYDDATPYTEDGELRTHTNPNLAPPVAARRRSMIVVNG